MAKSEGFNKDRKPRAGAARPNKNKKHKGEPAFNRYRNDSQPADYETSYKRNQSGDDKPFAKPERREKSKDGEKREFVKRDKPFERNESKGKKFFKDKPNGFGKPKRTVNPNDIDDSDLEYENKKTSSERFARKPFAPFKKTFKKGRVETKAKSEHPEGSVRLNKYISNAGICSRREADDLIASGVVQVNGKVITEMGFQVMPTDIVKYGGQTLRKEKMVYLILNKPKDYITTFDDPEKRRTVLELIQGACKERIYPVGRLDRATTGLLMFTNDGELTKKLTHPKYGVRKVYHVDIDKPLKQQDLKAIEEGIELEDGPIKVDEIAYVGDGKDKTQIGIELHSGKNRIVRRIFESFGYNVRKLDRVVFGSLTKKDLPRGRWRFLSEAEVGMLKMVSEKAV